jgi:hypothetical protein
MRLLAHGLQLSGWLSHPSVASSELGLEHLGEGGDQALDHVAGKVDQLRGELLGWLRKCLVLA